MPLLRRAPVVSTFLLLAAALTATAQPAATAPAVTHFDAAAYLAHIKYLASDELGGRQPGTDGIAKAAEYITRQFAAAGLKPAGIDGTWYQPFEVNLGKQLNDADAALSFSGIDRKWTVRRDWIPLPFTDMFDVDAPLAFAGYGIKADDYEYDDYGDFDASGKALLVFRYEPLADDPNAPFGGKEFSRYAMFRTKAHEAGGRGARALLIVNPPNRPDIPDELYPFTADATEQTFELPMIHVKREIAEAIVKAAGLGSLTELVERLDHERKPLARDLNVSMNLQQGVVPYRPTTRNVLGLLPGDGSTDDYIVVGAHYDHLGTQPSREHDNKPMVYNGADDNASGTAGVIELARVLAKERGLKRNVLFMTFSAEEMGLLGSDYFVAHPTVDLARIRAMVNFDMIGRLPQDQFTVFGVPSAPELEPLVKHAADAVGLSPRTPPGVADMSDHAPFYRKDIPFLFAFTGVHKEYHHPEDDWELIDADGAVRVLEMFHPIICDLANADRGPTFNKAGIETETKEAAITPGERHDAPAGPERDSPDPFFRDHAPSDDRHQAPTNDDAAKPTRPAVRLGIMPDVSGARSDEAGVVAVSVMDGSPAKNGGMKDGDRIIRINADPIKDIYGYMAALKGFKPDDTIEVVVVRGGKEVTLKIKLTAAERPRQPE